MDKTKNKPLNNGKTTEIKNSNIYSIDELKILKQQEKRKYR